MDEREVKLCSTETAWNRRVGVGAGGLAATNTSRTDCLPQRVTDGRAHQTSRHTTGRMGIEAVSHLAAVGDEFVRVQRVRMWSYGRRRAAVAVRTFRRHRALHLVFAHISAHGQVAQQ